jgi:hypothetical protein
VANIRRVLDLMHTWQISHINREANSTAHGLVRQVITHVIDEIWVKYIPICICEIVVLQPKSPFSIIMNDSIII